jgi:aryl-alcohol dehydrogenase-like predicted oxidoreductase
MQYRTLGKTGFQVSEIGYGAWGIGNTDWIGAEDQESLRALQIAIDNGLNFIDTALSYGDGHSETLVAQVAREQKSRIYISTKVPPKNGQWPARAGVASAEVFPKDYVIKCTEQSLKNLQVDTIDIQQFHVWHDSWVGQGDWLEAIQQLKAQGKIRAFGISINDHEPANAIHAIETGLVDTVQVIYNIFDQSPEDQLFAACQRHNVGVIVRVPFDEGGLTGKITPASTFDANDFRGSYFAGERKREVYERVQQMASDLGVSIDQIPAVALRFTLSHPAVSTVIPGMRSVRNAKSNIAVGDGKGLAADQIQILRNYRWVRNFYNW